MRYDCKQQLKRTAHDGLFYLREDKDVSDQPCTHSVTWAHLEDALLMNSNKVECLVDEVIAQCLEQTLHQRQTEPIHTGPGGGVDRLTGESLRQENQKGRKKHEQTLGC